MQSELSFFGSIAFSFIAWGWLPPDTSGRDFASGRGPKRCGLCLSSTASASSG
jgi:hypothetical protein